MGIIADIYRSSMGDCSNGGISSKVKEVTVVNAEGPFEPNPTRPAVILRKGPVDSVHAVPVKNVAGKWVPVNEMLCDGGTFIATSDSRFGEAIERVYGRRIYGAIALHDRGWTDPGPG